MTAHATVPAAVGLIGALISGRDVEGDAPDGTLIDGVAVAGLRVVDTCEFAPDSVESTDPEHATPIRAQAATATPPTKRRWVPIAGTLHSPAD
jgi:hypothetical protein